MGCRKQSHEIMGSTTLSFCWSPRFTDTASSLSRGNGLQGLPWRSIESPPSFPPRIFQTLLSVHLWLAPSRSLTDASPPPLPPSLIPCGVNTLVVIMLCYWFSWGCVTQLPSGATWPPHEGSKKSPGPRVYLGAQRWALSVSHSSWMSLVPRPGLSMGWAGEGRVNPGTY